jgi:hypothetical protein
MLLLRLVAFAASLREDAKNIAELAEQIQSESLTLFYESSGRDSDSEGWQRSRAALRPGTVTRRTRLDGSLEWFCPSCRHSWPVFPPASPDHPTGPAA